VRRAGGVRQPGGQLSLRHSFCIKKIILKPSFTNEKDALFATIEGSILSHFKIKI
jgi:hypothetical protein